MLILLDIKIKTSDKSIQMCKCKTEAAIWVCRVNDIIRIFGRTFPLTQVCVRSGFQGES